jgi:C1A family cysteine protease
MGEQVVTIFAAIRMSKKYILKVNPMKKIFTMAFIMAIILNLGGNGQSKSYPNPSAAYAEKMGYSYSIARDADGNEHGNVIFPDGSKADAWAFLRGKAGQQYSYCAKKGYTTESERIDHGGWIEETSVCSRVDKNGQKTKIPMLDLMEKNGEPMIEETVRPENNNPPEYKTNPNLKSATTLPTTFDWRNYNGHTYIGPIRNQDGCGSCYSFGANANAEGVYNFATGNYDGNCVDLSESFIIWCLGRVPAYHSHFFGCTGADFTYYELQALVDSGVTYEANFPYQLTDPGSCTHWNDPRIRFSDWYRVGCSDIEGIKTAIMTYGVVDAAVYVTASFQNYYGGIFSDASTSCSSSPCYYTSTNHAIALVGWGVDPVEGEYWILRNSWSSYWGEDGYMRIKTTSARVACEVAYLTYMPVEQGPPLATTTAASDISNNGATLNGMVNASNLPTTVTFEYGLTTSYGNTVNASPSIVNGSTNTAVRTILTGLLENTTYHFRVKAVNSMGTTYGTDLIFTTSAVIIQGGCADNYEPNNSQSASKLIVAGTEIPGLINPSGDLDWFRFSSTSLQKNIKIDLYNLPADYDVQLYDSKGKLLATSQNRGTASESIKYNATKVASYFIKVYGYSGANHATNCYALKVSLNNTQWRASDGIEIPGPIVNEPSMVVYPNPTTGKINLDYLSETTGKCNVRISNLTGVIILDKELSFTEGLNSYIIDLSGNSPGIYFLELTGNSNLIFKKVILQK